MDMTAEDLRQEFAKFVERQAASIHSTTEEDDALRAAVAALDDIIGGRMAPGLEEPWFSTLEQPGLSPHLKGA